jgi:hypothetical protein
MEVSGQLHAPAPLSPRKETMVHIGYKGGWVPEPLWRREKSLAPVRNATRFSL